MSLEKLVRRRQPHNPAADDRNFHRHGTHPAPSIVLGGSDQKRGVILSPQNATRLCCVIPSPQNNTHLSCVIPSEAFFSGAEGPAFALRPARIEEPAFAFKPYGFR
jgi:hypothetical protein